MMTRVADAPQTGSSIGITFELNSLKTFLIALLGECGTPQKTASFVVNDLVKNELRGYRSHGVLRLIDYIHAIKHGALDPVARPFVRRQAPSRSFVDGRSSFGALGARAVSQSMCSILREKHMALVSLTNSGHIGRLADIAEPVCAKGHIILGFANFQGGGQRVAPPGGAAPRLCTNPIVFGCASSRGPFILDMSTSTVAEGKVREYIWSGKSLPFNWLTDLDGQPCIDPKLLYTEPPQALMTSSGGRKGFFLGLAVEILAGIVTGGGFARPHSQSQGNAALFIGLRLDAAVQSGNIAQLQIADLLDYVQSTPLTPMSDPIRIPGQGHAHEMPATITLSTAVVEAIRRAIPTAIWPQSVKGGR